MVAREGETWQKRLVGYVVADAGAELRWRRSCGGSLRERLPEYMVPCGVHGAGRAAADAEREAGPGGAAGPGLARPDGPGSTCRRARRSRSCWPGSGRRVLGVDRVGATDNFFELGGHSLLATQVISRVRAVFGVEVALAALFDQPDGGRAGRGDGGGAGRAAAPPVTRGAGPGAAVVVRAAAAVVPGSAGAGVGGVQRADAVRLGGELDVAALRGALGAVVGRHEVLRTRLVVGPTGCRAR